ncbi:MAG: MerR family transcriptional regulator [Candidatus Omnitrophica bacterium]|nr:MerR family transcriptional regulator [Candidatus Omnitrophota bacterium]
MDQKEIYKIGEAVKLLQKDYPDISHSTLRFWEKEGLITPSEKTSGGQRFYSEYELDLVRIVKELSFAGNSKQEIVKRIENIKDEVKQGKLDNNALRGLIEGSKAARDVRSAIAEILKQRGVIGDKSWLEYIYDKETLVKLLDIKKGQEFIDKAEQYKLIFPKVANGVKKYNKIDEAILRAIIESNSDTLEQCKELYGVLNFLNSKLGINFGILEGIFSSALTDMIGTMIDTKKVKMMWIAVAVQAYINLQRR